MRIRIACWLLAAACLGGCTILTSETFDQLARSDRAPRGVQYSLPKGLVKVSLSVDPSTLGFTLTLDGGDIVADPDHEYILRYRANPAYDDDITVKTDDKGLLSKVNTTTTDRTADIIVNVAKAVSVFGGLEAAAAAAEVVVLYQNQFDPLSKAERSRVVAEIDRRILAHLDGVEKGCAIAGGEKSQASKYLKTVSDQKVKKDKLLANLQKEKLVVDAAVKEVLERVAKGITSTADTIACSPSMPPDSTNPVDVACGLLGTQQELQGRIDKEQGAQTKLDTAMKDLQAQDQSKSGICKGVSALKKPGNRPRATIKLPELPDDEAEAPGPTADCSVGICYRPAEPVRITYSLGEGQSTLVVDLPNPSAIVQIDIRRAFFVKKVQSMDFTRGVLTKLAINKQSELLAISKLPVSVIEAIAEGIKIRANVTTQHKNVLDKEAALLQAQADLAKARGAGSGSAASLESGQKSAATVKRPGASSRTVTP